MDYKKAQNYWKAKDVQNIKMPDEMLQKRIEEFVQSHNTMALATGYGSYVRCTPVEYTFYKHLYWIMSEGGRKFIGLENNKNVSFAVFDAYAGFGSVHGLQIDGTARLIEPFSHEYNELLAYKKIPAAAIRNMEEPMPMIQIIPVSADFLDSSLKEEKYSVRQHLEY